MPTLDSLTPYLTLLIFLAPLLPRLLNLLTRSLSPSPHPRSPRPPLPRVVWALLALHSLYHLLPFFLPSSDDPNIFSQTNTPLFAASTGELRSRLERMAHGGVLSGATQQILAKLQSYDARLLYARYGQKAMLDCTWCAPASSEQGAWDLWVYWAVGAARAAVGEVAFWGLVTGLSGRENWRKVGVWCVIGGLVLEAGWRGWGGVELGGQRGEGRMIHSLLSLLTPIIHTLLPLLLPLLPAPPSPSVSPLSILPSLLSPMETLLTHLKLLELSRIATLRVPALRDAVVATASQIAADGKAAMGNAGVQEAGERVGLTSEEGVRGGLREGARGFLGVARARMEATLGGMGMGRGTAE